jgi:hypothetical protein
VAVCGRATTESAVYGRKDDVDVDRLLDMVAHGPPDGMK